MSKPVYAASLAAAFALFALSAHAEPKTSTYTILKEGDPIGKETYVIDQDGDKTSLHLTADSKVHIVFLNFTYHHERTENWTGTTLDKLVSTTDDDGTKHHVEYADGKLTADGKSIALGADAFPLSMWRKAVVDHTALFAVENDDGVQKVAFKDVGPETLDIAGQKVACEHYAMTGDVDRDFWYDPDGMLAKVTFRRRGFGIAIVRDN